MRELEIDALADKVAIVIVARSGIGRVPALLFVQERAKLVVTARRQSKLDTLVTEIEAAGGEAVAIVADVKDESLAKEDARKAFTRGRPMIKACDPKRSSIAQ
jgi:NADP-dependent 3-hydroxy acid dehydrogenase YdfG